MSLKIIKDIERYSIATKDNTLLHSLFDQCGVSIFVNGYLSLLLAEQKKNLIKKKSERKC